MHELVIVVVTEISLLTLLKCVVVFPLVCWDIIS